MNNKHFCVVFDLDGTLINSFHRWNKKGIPYSQLDFNYWSNHNTKDDIFEDTLLPLKILYDNYCNVGYTIIFLTSRKINLYDFEFFERKELFANLILERKDSLELDHELKERRFQELFNIYDLFPLYFYDDKPENLDVGKKFGFQTFDSKELNIQLNNFIKTKGDTYKDYIF